MTRDPAIGVLLLAAGRSRRFGDDKRRARMRDGGTLLEHTVRLYAQVPGPLCLVLRSDDDPHELLDADELARSRIVRAPDSDLGMGHSLAAGVSACPDVDALLVGLADMPWIRRDTLDSLLARAASAIAEDVVIRPIHHDRPGHPILFPRTWFARLASCHGDAGARELLRGSNAVRHVQTDDPGVLTDIDTPAQLDPS